MALAQMVERLRVAGDPGERARIAEDIRRLAREVPSVGGLFNVGTVPTEMTPEQMTARALGGPPAERPSVAPPGTQTPGLGQPAVQTMTRPPALPVGEEGAPATPVPPGMPGEQPREQIPLPIPKAPASGPIPNVEALRSQPAATSLDQVHFAVEEALKAAAREQLSGTTAAAMQMQRGPNSLTREGVQAIMGRTVAAALQIARDEGRNMPNLRDVARALREVGGDYADLDVGVAANGKPISVGQWITAAESQLLGEPAVNIATPQELFEEGIVPTMTTTKLGEGTQRIGEKSKGRGEYETAAAPGGRERHLVSEALGEKDLRNLGSLGEVIADVPHDQRARFLQRLRVFTGDLLRAVVPQMEAFESAAEGMKDQIEQATAALEANAKKEPADTGSAEHKKWQTAQRIQEGGLLFLHDRQEEYRKGAADRRQAHRRLSIALNRINQALSGPRTAPQEQASAAVEMLAQSQAVIRQFAPDAADFLSLAFEPTLEPADRLGQITLALDMVKDETVSEIRSVDPTPPELPKIPKAERPDSTEVTEGSEGKERKTATYTPQQQMEKERAEREAEQAAANEPAPGEKGIGKSAAEYIEEQVRDEYEAREGKEPSQKLVDKTVSDRLKMTPEQREKLHADNMKSAQAEGKARTAAERKAADEAKTKKAAAAAARKAKAEAEAAKRKAAIQAAKDKAGKKKGRQPKPMTPEQVAAAEADYKLAQSLHNIVQTVRDAWATAMEAAAGKKGYVFWRGVPADLKARLSPAAMARLKELVGSKKTFPRAMRMLRRKAAPITAEQRQARRAAAGAPAPATTPAVTPTTTPKPATGAKPPSQPKPATGAKPPAKEPKQPTALDAQRALTKEQVAGLSERILGIVERHLRNNDPTQATTVLRAANVTHPALAINQLRRRFNLGPPRPPKPAPAPGTAPKPPAATTAPKPPGAGETLEAQTRRELAALPESLMVRIRKALTDGFRDKAELMLAGKVTNPPTAAAILRRDMGLSGKKPGAAAPAPAPKPGTAGTGATPTTTTTSTTNTASKGSGVAPSAAQAAAKDQRERILERLAGLDKGWMGRIVGHLRAGNDEQALNILRNIQQIESPEIALRMLKQQLGIPDAGRPAGGAQQGQPSTSQAQAGGAGGGAAAGGRGGGQGAAGGVAPVRGPDEERSASDVLAAARTGGAAGANAQSTLSAAASGLAGRVAEEDVPKTKPPLITINKSSLPPVANHITLDFGKALDEYGREGVNRILQYFKRVLANPKLPAFFAQNDGTGVGKTRQLLAAAHEINKLTKKPVLILTENKTTVKSFMFDEPENMRVDGAKLGDFEPVIHTYDDLRAGKVPKKEWGAVLYDEAQNIKNPTAQVTEAADQLKTGFNVLATATQFDSPASAIPVLARMLGRDVRDVAAAIGTTYKERKGKGEVIAEPLANRDEMEVWDGIANLVNELTKMGQVVRREFPYWGTVKFAGTNATVAGQHAELEQRLLAYWQNMIDLEPDPGKKQEYFGKQVSELRTLSELMKVDDAFRRAIDILKNTKDSVVIVAESVNDFTFEGLRDAAGKPVTMKGALTQLAERFDKALKPPPGQKTVMSKIYGGGDKTNEIRDFKTNKHRVALMTALSGGVGVELDDQTGKAPRQMIMITQPWAGDLFEQTLGRISRRRTVTPSKVEIMEFPHSVADAHSRQVLSAKIGVVAASQQGADPQLKRRQAAAIEFAAAKQGLAARRAGEVGTVPTEAAPAEETAPAEVENVETPPTGVDATLLQHKAAAAWLDHYDKVQAAVKAGRRVFGYDQKEGMAALLKSHGVSQRVFDQFETMVTMAQRTYGTRREEIADYLRQGLASPNLDLSGQPAVVRKFIAAVDARPELGRAWAVYDRGRKTKQARDQAAKAFGADPVALGNLVENINNIEAQYANPIADYLRAKYAPPVDAAIEGAGITRQEARSILRELKTVLGDPAVAAEFDAVLDETLQNFDPQNPPRIHDLLTRLVGTLPVSSYAAGLVDFLLFVAPNLPVLPLDERGMAVDRVGMPGHSQSWGIQATNWFSGTRTIDQLRSVYVAINPVSEDKTTTFLHEVVHAATHLAYVRAKASNDPLATTLDRLFLAAQPIARRLLQAGQLTTDNAALSVAEFMAEILTDAQLREQLRTYPVPFAVRRELERNRGFFGNLYDAIIDTFNGLLGRAVSHSLLDAAINLTTDIAYADREYRNEVGEVNPYRIDPQTGQIDWAEGDARVGAEPRERTMEEALAAITRQPPVDPARAPRGWEGVEKSDEFDEADEIVNRAMLDFNARRGAPSSQQLLRAIERTSSNPFYRMLAGQLLKFAPDVPVVPLNRPSSDPVLGPYYSDKFHGSHFSNLRFGTPFDKRRAAYIGLNPGIPFPVRTFLHEMVHVVTVSQWARAQANGETIAKNFTDLFERARPYLINSGIAAADRAAENVKEFIAYGLTSPEVQELLKTIPMPLAIGVQAARGRSFLSSVFEGFVDAVRNLLGVSGYQNAMAGLIDLTGALAQQDLAYRKAHGEGNYRFDRATGQIDWATGDRALGITPQMPYGFAPKPAPSEASEAYEAMAANTTSLLGKGGLKGAPQTGASFGGFLNDLKADDLSAGAQALQKATTAGRRVFRTALYTSSLDQIKQWTDHLMPRVEAGTTVAPTAGGTSVGGVTRLQQLYDKLQERISGLSGRETFTTFKGKPVTQMELFETWQKMTAKEPEKAHLFNQILTASSMHRIEIEKDITDIQKGLQANPNEPLGTRARMWKLLRPQYDKLGADWQALHKAVKANYQATQRTRQKAMFKRLRQSILKAEPNRAITTDFSDAKAVKNATDLSDSEKRAIRNIHALYPSMAYYVPLRRRGPYVVRANLHVDHDNNLFDVKDADQIKFDFPDGRLQVKLDPVARGKARLEVVKIEEGEDGADVPTGGYAGVPLKLYERFATREQAENRIRQLNKVAATYQSRFKGGVTLDVYSLDQQRHDPGAIINDPTISHAAQANWIRQIEAVVRDPEERDRLKKLAYETTAGMLPDTYAAKSKVTRRNIAGASTDQLRAFEEYIIAFSHNVGHIENDREISDLLEYMRAEVRKLEYHGNDEVREKAQLVMRELTERDKAQDVKQDISTFVKIANSAAYLWLLSSASYSMIQMSQPWVVGLPLMGARFGFARAAGELTRASLLFTATTAKAGLTNTLKQFYGPDSHIFDYEKIITEQLKGQPDRDRLIKGLRTLRDRRLLDMTMNREVHEAATRPTFHHERTVGNKLSVAGQWLMDLSRAFPHAVEINGRASVFTAAYRMEYARSKDHDKAVAAGIEYVRRSQIDYNPANKPRVFQSRAAGGAITIPMMFKQFALHMYQEFALNFANSVRGEDKATRREARRAIMGLLSTHALVGGAAAIMLEPIKIVAALTMMLLGGDEEDPFDIDRWMHESLNNALGPSFGEVAFRGLPALAGVDVSQRVGLSNLMFFNTVEDIQKGKDPLAIAGALLTGPAGGVFFKQMPQAFEYFAVGDVQRGVEFLLPKQLKDGLRVMRFADEGMLDKHGNLIMRPGDIDTGSLVSQFLGFQPTQISDVYEARGAIIDKKTAIENRTQRLYERYWRARGDYEARAEIREEIRAFNRANPKSKITPEKLEQSMRQRRDREREAGKTHGVYLPKSQRYFAEEAGYLQ